MRRLLMLVLTAALSFAAFGPAQAQAGPTEGNSIVFLCTGTGGYHDTPSGPQWRAETHRIVVPTPIVGVPYEPTCRAWAPGTADAPFLPNVPADPTDPFGWFDQLWYYAWHADFTPVSVGANFDAFSAVGDFACGEGTLTEPATGQNSIHYAHALLTGYQDWIFEDLTATFSDGVGEVSGTVRNEDSSEIRAVSGNIVIDDGAAVGQCDDSAGNSNVAFALVLSPASS